MKVARPGPALFITFILSNSEILEAYAAVGLPRRPTETSCYYRREKTHIKAKVDVSFDDYWFFVKSNRRQESASPLHVESFYACKTYPVCRK